MSLVINTNYAATVASNNLAYSNSMLQNSLNELSSGSKLTTSASDAGGTALALSLNSQATNDGALIQANANNLASLQTADGALQVAGAILTRLSQLNTLSYNVSGGTGTSATGSYASEFSALQTELHTVDPTGSSSTSDSGSVSGSPSLPTSQPSPRCAPRTVLHRASMASRTRSSPTTRPTPSPSSAR